VDGTRKQTDRVAGREMAAAQPRGDVPDRAAGEHRIAARADQRPGRVDRTGPAAGPAGPAGWEKLLWQALKGSQATHAVQVRAAACSSSQSGKTTLYLSHGGAAGPKEVG